MPGTTPGMVVSLAKCRVGCCNPLPLLGPGSRGENLAAGSSSGFGPGSAASTTSAIRPMSLGAADAELCGAARSGPVGVSGSTEKGRAGSLGSASPALALWSNSVDCSTGRSASTALGGNAECGARPAGRTCELAAACGASSDFVALPRASRKLAAAGCPSVRPAPACCRGSLAGRPPPITRSDDIIGSLADEIGRLGPEHYLSVAFESLRRGHDLLLCRLDLGEAHRPSRLDLFPQHLGSALRQIAQHLVL